MRNSSSWPGAISQAINRPGFLVDKGGCSPYILFLCYIPIQYLVEWLIRNSLLEKQENIQHWIGIRCEQITIRYKAIETR